MRRMRSWSSAHRALASRFSINNVVHGTPSPRDVLREGDIIGIDFDCYRQPGFVENGRVTRQPC